MPQNPELSRDPDYFAARSVEERRLAMAAKDPNSRAAHLKMAETYALMASEAAASAEPKAQEQQEAS